MRLLLLIILSLSFSNSVFSQKKKHSRTYLSQAKKLQEQAQLNSKCLFTGKFTPVQIASSFPFNQATKIRLVSFEQTKRPFGSIILEFGHETDDDYIIDSVKVDTLDWEEDIFLDSKSYLELGNIIFNYEFTALPAKIEENKCYNPRNAILFYNDKNEIIAVIEICFGCNKIVTYPEGLSTGDECSDKLDLYRKFLVKNGIRYGTLNSD